MDASTLLGLYIEVYTALAVGGGIVIALKHQSQRAWTREEGVRFRFLTIAGGTGAFYSALPFILFSIGLDDETVWKTASSLFLVTTLLVGPYRAYQMRGTPTFWGALGQVAITIVLSGYAIHSGEEWIYLVLLTLMIASVFGAFATLVIQSARAMGSDV